VTALPPSADVVVVGAGLAGLCAARVLTRAGLGTVVVESGDAVGGRVRTDVVDGFRLDRGFQVFNTAYPEAAQVLDYAALDLRPFVRGALVHLGGRLHRLADPRQQPRAALSTVTAPIGSARDKLRLARMTAAVVAAPPRRLLARPETTTYAALRQRGLSDAVIDRFLRPFLAGVFLETDLTTSSRFFDLVWRTFVLGTVCIPAAGMAAIPEQLAAGLPAGTVHLGTSARRVAAGRVETSAGAVRARAVVVAADPEATADLVPGVRRPPVHAVTTYYHAADAPPVGDATIVLDGERRGPVVNTVVLSNAAPSYAADGRALVSSSVVGAEQPAEPVVRRELARLYGLPTGDWEHLGTAHVPRALPDAAPPLGDLRLPVRLGDGRYVAGDARDSPSIQGAMVSGRRAATAVLEDLRR